MTLPPLSRQIHRQKQAAFSLVEVTLAIGIVAFAFVALFGLVPTGLNVFRSAIDTSIGSTILQQVVENAQETDYDALQNTSIPDAFYDEQGDLLTTNGAPLQVGGDPAIMAKAIYRVHVTVLTPTKFPATQDSSNPSTKNVATLQVQVAKDPGHSSNPFGAGNKANINNYIAYVSRNRAAL